MTFRNPSEQARRALFQETKNFGLPTSVFRLPTSNTLSLFPSLLNTLTPFGLPSSNFRLRSSDFQLPTSDFQLLPIVFLLIKIHPFVLALQGFNLFSCFCQKRLMLCCSFIKSSVLQCFTNFFDLI